MLHCPSTRSERCVTCKEGNKENHCYFKQTFSHHHKMIPLKETHTIGSSSGVRRVRAPRVLVKPLPRVQPGCTWSHLARGPLPSTQPWRDDQLLRVTRALPSVAFGDTWCTLESCSHLPVSASASSNSPAQAASLKEPKSPLLLRVSPFHLQKQRNPKRCCFSPRGAFSSGSIQANLSKVTWVHRC